MKIHPVKVEGYDGTVEELAQKVFSLRYDKLADFLVAGARELERQRENDKKIRKLRQLPVLLSNAVAKAGDLAATMKGIYFFCEPHMKDELEQNLKSEGGRHD